MTALLVELLKHYEVFNLAVKGFTQLFGRRRADVRYRSGLDRAESLVRNARILRDPVQRFLFFLEQLLKRNRNHVEHISCNCSFSTKVKSRMHQADL